MSDLFPCYNCLVKSMCNNVHKCQERFNAEMFSCRYADNLIEVLKEYNGKKVLRLDFEYGYEGHVDIDILLGDGRVFSYYYSYGSCSGCDEWESRNLTDQEVVETMKKEATMFDNIDEYNKWREMCTKNENSLE